MHIARVGLLVSTSVAVHNSFGAGSIWSSNCNGNCTEANSCWKMGDDVRKVLGNCVLPLGKHLIGIDEGKPRNRHRPDS